MKTAKLLLALFMLVSLPSTTLASGPDLANVVDDAATAFRAAYKKYDDTGFEAYEALKAHTKIFQTGVKNFNNCNAAGAFPSHAAKSCAMRSSFETWRTKLAAQKTAHQALEQAASSLNSAIDNFYNHLMRNGTYTADRANQIIARRVFERAGHYLSAGRSVRHYWKLPMVAKLVGANNSSSWTRFLSAGHLAYGAKQGVRSLPIVAALMEACSASTLHAATIEHLSDEAREAKLQALLSQATNITKDVIHLFGTNLQVPETQLHKEMYEQRMGQLVNIDVQIAKLVGSYWCQRPEEDPSTITQAYEDLDNPADPEDPRYNPDEIISWERFGTWDRATEVLSPAGHAIIPSFVPGSNTQPGEMRTMPINVWPNLYKGMAALSLGQELEIVPVPCGAAIFHNWTDAPHTFCEWGNNPPDPDCKVNVPENNPFSCSPKVGPAVEQSKREIELRGVTEITPNSF